MFLSVNLDDLGPVFFFFFLILFDDFKIISNWFQLLKEPCKQIAFELLSPWECCSNFVY